MINISASDDVLRDYNHQKQLLLCKIVAQSPHLQARILAMSAIWDRELVERIATQDPAPEMREAAVRKLGNKSLVLKIIQEDKNDSVRIAARKRLNEPQILEQLDWGNAYELQKFLPFVADQSPVIPFFKAQSEVKRRFATSTFEDQQCQRVIASITDQAL